MVNVLKHPWFESGDGRRIVSGLNYKSRCPLVRKPREWNGECGMKGCPDYQSCTYSESYRKRK